MPFYFILFSHPVFHPLISFFSLISSKYEFDYFTPLLETLIWLLIAFKSASRPFLAWHAKPFVFWLQPVSPTSSSPICLPLPLTSPHFTCTVCYCSVLLSFLWEEYSRISTHLPVSGTCFPFWLIILKQLKCWLLQKDLSDNSLFLILVKCSSCALWAACFWLTHCPWR